MSILSKRCFLSDILLPSSGWKKTLCETRPKSPRRTDRHTEPLSPPLTDRSSSSSHCGSVGDSYAMCSRLGIKRGSPTMDDSTQSKKLRDGAQVNTVLIPPHRRDASHSAHTVCKLMFLTPRTHQSP